jgi:hypothetical protein
MDNKTAVRQSAMTAWEYYSNLCILVDGVQCAGYAKKNNALLGVLTANAASCYKAKLHAKEQWTLGRVYLTAADIALRTPALLVETPHADEYAFSDDHLETAPDGTRQLKDLRRRKYPYGPSYDDMMAAAWRTAGEQYLQVCARLDQARGAGFSTTHPDLAAALSTAATTDYTTALAEGLVYDTGAELARKGLSALESVLDGLLESLRTMQRNADQVSK